MAPRRTAETLLITVFLAVAFCGVTVAQTQTQTQTQSSCTSVLISLSPCLDYITGNASVPSSACCSQLASVVSSQPQCLCEVVNGDAASVGLNINQTLALALPAACKVQTPPVSSCNASPPMGGSATTYSPSGTGSGSYTFPTTTGSSARGGLSSQGSSTKLPSSLFIFFLFVTSLTFI